VLDCELLLCMLGRYLDAQSFSRLNFSVLSWYFFFVASFLISSHHRALLRRLHHVGRCLAVHWSSTLLQYICSTRHRVHLLSHHRRPEETLGLGANFLPPAHLIHLVGAAITP